MAITLGELLIKLTAKTDAFQKGMNDAKRLAFDSSSDIVSSLGRIGESLAKLKFDNLNQVAASLNRVGGIIAGVAVGVATASIAAAEHVALQAKEIDKLSQSYGLSVQQISAFRVAATITGVSLDTITSGMSRLAKNAATVAESVGGHSSKGAAAAFNALGISITPAKLQSAQMNDLLGEVAEKFSKLAPGVEKTALAIQIFGKGGAAMLPFLNEGKEGLEKLRQLSDDLGLTWTEKDVKAARAFGESVEILKLKGEAFEEQLAKGLYPALNAVVTAFANVDKTGTSLGQSLGSTIGSAFVAIAEAIAYSTLAIRSFILQLQHASEVADKSPLWQKLTGISALKGLGAIDDITPEIQHANDQTAKFISILDSIGNKTASFGKGGGGLAGILGKPEDIHKINEELRTLSDETAKLLTKDSGDKFAQQILALNIQIGKLRDFGTDHQKLGDSFLTGIANQIDKLNEQIDALNIEKVEAFAKFLQAPLPTNLFSFQNTPIASDQVRSTRELFEITNDLNRAQQVGDQVYRDTRTDAERYVEQIKILNELVKQGTIGQDTFNRAVANLGTLSPKALDGARSFFKQYSEYAKQAGRQIYDALANAFSKLEDTLADFFTTFKADWASLAKSIEQEIVKIAIRGLITGPLAGALGKIFGVKTAPKGTADDPLYVKQVGIGGVPGVPGTPDGTNPTGGINGIFSKLWESISGIFKNLGSILTKVFSSIGSFLGGLFGGGKAAGGPVSAGTLYQVKEHGMEFFRPNVNGHIIPLGQMAAAGGGFTFAPTYYISTPNADSFRKSQHQTITEGLDSAQRAQRRR